MMQLVSNGTLCLIDVGDAALRSGGNALTFCLHFNFAASLRLSYLVLREINVRVGAVLDQKIAKFYKDIMAASKVKKKNICARWRYACSRIRSDLMKYMAYCESVEAEYRYFGTDEDD